MDARTKASVLWGVVGALSFLVLLQGYRLVDDLDVGVLPALAVAAVVFVAATVAAYAADGYRH